MDAHQTFVAKLIELATSVQLGDEVVPPIILPIAKAFGWEQGISAWIVNLLMIALTAWAVGGNISVALNDASQEVRLSLWMWLLGPSYVDNAFSCSGRSRQLVFYSRGVRGPL